MKRIICAGLALAAVMLITSCSNGELPANSTISTNFEDFSANDTASSVPSSSLPQVASSSNAESSARSSSASSPIVSGSSAVSSVISGSSAVSSVISGSSTISSVTPDSSVISSAVSSSKPVSSTSPNSVSSSTEVYTPIIFPEVYTETDEITGGKLDAEYSYIIEDGETLNIRSGETLLINGLLNCENGGSIVVDKGGSLMVNGQIKLSGELTLCGGGELLLSSGSRICGSGTASISSFNDIDCAGDFTARIKPPMPVTENGITTVGGVLIVNKKYSLPKSYGSGLTSETVTALNTMRSGSGYGMPIVSGFRSYESQERVFAGWCAQYGEATASTLSARPGQSEHQSGLTMDITSLSQSYGDTAEGRWVAENCYKYGFIVRYPKGKDNITGYMYEPWHLRYLGKSTAKLVHDSGLTLEEFLGVQG